MGGYHNFYDGSKGLNWSMYGNLDPYQDELFQGMSYRVPVASVGISSDPRTANQLKAVSDKLNTGAKVVEISTIQPSVLESIPKQHFDELRRLSKLVGAELTLHGPLVEPTGISQQGWDEAKRIEAERQMWHALEMGKKLSDNGNVIVTFHSSAGLPELEEKYKTEEGVQKAGELWVIDEREGKFARIKPKELHLSGEKGEPRELLSQLNKESWESSLSRASFHAYEGQKIIERILDESKEIPKHVEEKLKKELKDTSLIKIYKTFRSSDGQEILEKLDPEIKKYANQVFGAINYGEIYLRDSYNELQNLFDQAYDTALKRGTDKDKMTIEKLNKFREEIRDLVEKGSLKDVEKLEVFGEKIIEGIRLLSSIQPPEIYKPLQTFAIDKASDTFANLSLRAYKEFKEKAPIISIENPPAGSGLSRGEDLRKLVEEARRKFVERAQTQLGLSKKEAESIAEKQIGVTWDVGHINMLRKYGYTEKDLSKETEKIAKFVKHVHLSDNFGLEHTELPMGMGNVPTKEHLELLNKYNKQLKKIIEAGNWYEPFKKSPVPETLAALGSPVYGMAMAPYWNNARAAYMGAYFAGYGLNPDYHHSIYGAGFANLPVELGGQMHRKNRLSGTPMD